MKKFPLNQKGIQELQKSLHDLPDSKLAIEVASIRLDFRQWISMKFELSLSELANLNQLNDYFIAYAAITASNFLAQRKLITLSVIELKENLKKVLQYDN